MRARRLLGLTTVGTSRLSPHTHTHPHPRSVWSHVVSHRGCKTSLTCKRLCSEIEQIEHSCTSSTCCPGGSVHRQRLQAIREKTSGLETLRRRKTSASIQVLACFRTRTRSLRSLGLAWCRMSPASGRYSYVACYLESFGLGSVPSLAFALSLALFASVSLSLSRLLSLARLSL